MRHWRLVVTSAQVNMVSAYEIHYLFPCAASYGSTLRYKSVERIKAVGKHSLIGGSGEFSDFQEILRYLDELT
jgi:hypothetical protein